MKNFYITTTLPYVNARLHIGHALEFVQADLIARYHKIIGDNVFFNTGTDEHGQKIYEKSLKERKDPKIYVDECAIEFKKVLKGLNILPEVNFIRTTDKHHIIAAQEFWRRCFKNGDIYKRKYKVKYCVGCELEKTDSELKDGKCPLHPNREIEFIDEENYFFRFSKYAQALLTLYKKYPDFVVPVNRLTEIKNFVAAGLQDFSISRLKDKMPWGVPVPDDNSHIMYVWFDALVNYISALEWPENERKFEEFWGTKENPNALQIAGKDNLRQQSAMWQAMLLSAGLPTSRQILIHGFINIGGQKISKSLGNTVDLLGLINRYGTDAVRFWLLKEVNPFEDADFTLEKFKESYNAKLANGLGNLVSRVVKLARNCGVEFVKPKEDAKELNAHAEKINGYRFGEAMGAIWEKIQITDKFMQEREPFKKIKAEPEKAVADIRELLEGVWEIGALLRSLLPETSEKIRAVVENDSIHLTPIFPRAA